MNLCPFELLHYYLQKMSYLCNRFPIAHLHLLQEWACLFYDSVFSSSDTLFVSSKNRWHLISVCSSTIRRSCDKTSLSPTMDLSFHFHIIPSSFLLFCRWALLLNSIFFRMMYYLLLQAFAFVSTLSGNFKLFI